MGYRMKRKPESMRVVNVTEKKEERAYTCGDCALGCWNRWNRNYRGEPFYGYCEFSKWAKTKDGRGVFLDNQRACEHFSEGEKKEDGK